MTPLERARLTLLPKPRLVDLITTARLDGAREALEEQRRRHIALNGDADHVHAEARRLLALIGTDPRAKEHRRTLVRAVETWRRA
jgi:hypothetical protein